MFYKRLKELFYTKYVISSILVLAVVIVYWPAFFNQFLLQWDDQTIAMNYFTESSFTGSNLWAILTTYYAGQYAPINQLFYSCLYFIGGNSYNPVVFHAACIVIHILNVLLVFVFIKRLLLQTTNFSDSSALRTGFLTALLIGVHPFLVEAVAWISASKIILYVFLLLIGLLFYLKYIETSRIKYWCLTLLFFILSFGAKEQAVVMPLILLLIDYALKRNFKDRKIWFEKLPFFLLALLFGLITIKSQSEVRLNAPDAYPFYQRLVFACYSLTEYFTKFLLPIKLSYLYPFPNQPGESLPMKFWLYPVAIMTLVIGLWGYLKKNRWPMFGLAWFVIGLLPALHIVSIGRFAIVADRYSYLSGIGLLFIVAFLVNKMIENRSIYRTKILIIGSVYLVSIGVYAKSRTKVWYDTDSLKRELREQITERNDYPDNNDK